MQYLNKISRHLLRLSLLSLPLMLNAATPTPLESSLKAIETGSADETTMKMLPRWAADGEMAVRSAALVALGEVGDKSAEGLAALKRGLDYPDESTRSNAASALMRLGEEGEAILRDRLKDTSLPLRSRLEAMMALRSSVAGLRDPDLRKQMEAIYVEIDAESNPDPSPASGSVLVNGDFASSQFDKDWELLREGGAKGDVRIDASSSRRPGSGSLLMEKTNSTGELVLRSRQTFKVKAGQTPTIRLYFRADDAPGNSILQILLEDSNGAVRIGDLSRGHAAQSQSVLQNTGPGQWERRMAQTQKRKEDMEYRVRIVLKGNPAKVWIDDVAAPAVAYRYSYPPGMRSAVEPARTDVTEPTAPVEAKMGMEGGHPRLLVNGEAIAPVMYFIRRTSFGDYAGMNEIGNVPLMVATVALDDMEDPRYPPHHPTWSKLDSLDFRTAFDWLDKAAADAPEGLFIISFNVTWPEDWAASNPDEIWLNAKGEKGYGTSIHFRGFADELPGGHDKYLGSATAASQFRWWPSPFSERAIADVGSAIETFMEELAKKPYANRVIGCHITGGHDGQFYTAHWPDYSAPALKAWRQWLTQRYGSDEALQQAWNDVSVTLQTAEIPVKADNPQTVFLDPLTERRIADHSQFQAEAGMRIRDALAGAFKRASKADESIGMTWQLGGGRGQGAETIFANSDALDIAVPQPAYQLRRPGLAGGLKAPLQTFGSKAKMVVSELDLRTWMRAGGTEIPSYRLGTATSPEMFRQIVRKEAAPMITKGHGFWFFDISAGMFRDPEMIEVAAEAVRAYEELEIGNTDPYRPEVAVVYSDIGDYWVHNGFRADNFINTLDRQTHTYLRESGLVFDQLLLSDLLAQEQESPYKVIVFLQAWRLSDAEREAIAQKLQNNGRYLVWNFGSAYVGDGRSGDAVMEEVIGMPVRSEPIRTLPQVLAADGSGRLLGNGETSLLMTKQGSSSRSLPRGSFRTVVNDPKATKLGHYEDGATAVAMREFDDWTSVYFGLPGTMDPLLLSELAERAGAHRLSEDRVVADFNGRFLSLHGLQNGPVQLNLPSAGTLTDFATGEVIATGQKVSVPVQAGQTLWLKFTPAAL